MNSSNSRLSLGLVLFLFLFLFSDLLLAGGPALKINTPTSPPEWALLERELLRASSIACEEFSPVISTMVRRPRFGTSILSFSPDGGQKEVSWH